MEPATEPRHGCVEGRASAGAAAAEFEARQVVRQRRYNGRWARLDAGRLELGKQLLVVLFVLTGEEVDHRWGLAVFERILAVLLETLLGVVEYAPDGTAADPGPGAHEAKCPGVGRRPLACWKTSCEYRSGYPLKCTAAPVKFTRANMSRSTSVAPALGELISNSLMVGSTIEAAGLISPFFTKGWHWR